MINEDMRRLTFYCMTTMLGIFLTTFAVCAQTNVKTLSLSELELRLAEIDNELEQLATLSLNGGVSSIGYQSSEQIQPGRQALLHIDLGEKQLIDQVVLVPTLWRDTLSLIHI